MTLQSSVRPPYPVLAENTNDYTSNSAYTVVSHITRRIGKDINIGVQHRLASPSILELVGKGQADYAIRISCPATRNRRLYIATDEKQAIVLPETEYQEHVDLEPMVIANTDIPAWRAADWSPRTKGLLPEGIAIPGGALLAAAVRERIDLNDLPAGDSIVSLTPTDNPDLAVGHWQVDLNGDKIKIIARQETVTEIRRFLANETYHDAVWPSLYLSAIQTGVRRHQHEDHSDRRWAASIRRRLESCLGDNYPPEQEDLDANDLHYAQLILEDPLAKMLSLQTNAEAEA